jgi:hypothetical protein
MSQDRILYYGFIYIHKSEFFFKKFIHNLCIKICLTIFHLASNTVRACQSLGYHILALELDTEVLTKVLEPLVEMAMLELDTKHVHNFDIVSLDKKCSKRLLDYE